MNADTTATWEEFDTIRRRASRLMRITGYMFWVTAIVGSAYVIGQVQGLWAFHPLIFALVVVVILMILSGLAGYGVWLNDKAWRLLLELYKIESRRAL